jgi:spore coat polysaccharide biosynthesis protein SpsF
MTGIIILVRFNSSRLIGKALLNISGKPVLKIILERLEQVVSRDNIIVATSEESTDNPIMTFCIEQKIQCYRGSLLNVAQRFYEAGLSKKWTYAVRINGDNVFLDINVLRNLIQLTEQGCYDFVSNVKGRSFPKGMSVEVVRLQYYASVLPQINASSVYQEHVTLYLYDNEPEKAYFYLNQWLPQAAGIQLALDTSEDLIRTKRIMNRFIREHWHYNLYEIYQIWKQLEYENAL